MSSTSPSQGDSTTSAVERLAFQHAVHALIRTTSVSGIARSTNWETHQLQMLRTTDAYDYFPIIRIVNLRHAERRGETLRDRLNTARKLPVDEAVRLTQKVAGALDYAHHQGVVHRGIKPAPARSTRLFSHGLVGGDRLRTLPEFRRILDDIGLTAWAAMVSSPMRAREIGLSLTSR